MEKPEVKEFILENRSFFGVSFSNPTFFYTTAEKLKCSVCKSYLKKDGYLNFLIYKNGEHLLTCLSPSCLEKINNQKNGNSPLLRYGIKPFEEFTKMK